MTNKEILEQAIQKAIDGGWSRHYDNNFKVVVTPSSTRIFVKLIDQRAVLTLDAATVIFNHDFAKALWGESGVPTLPLGGRLLHPWEAHLQQMVIAEDPIKYLGENL